MKQYLALMIDVIAHGRYKMDRTGVGCYSLFGTQMRFEDIGQNFPLVTSRKLTNSFNNAIIELLWFLSGSTNNKNLTDQNCNIWSLWALKEDATELIRLSNHELVLLIAEVCEVDEDEARSFIQHNTTAAVDELLGTRGSSAYVEARIHLQGDLGPIYGEQWTNWGGAPETKGINQIEEVIKNLKAKPFSRRHVISAWNPTYLPDESVSPEENVANGRMCLAPCHCLFQFHVEEMTTEELNVALSAWLANKVAFIGEYTDMSWTTRRARTPYMRLGENVVGDETFIVNTREELRAKLLEFCEKTGMKPYRLSCQLYQRSADYPVGVCTNIVSYSLLTMMVAQCCDMFPGDFVWTGGDTHVYTNQLADAETQLERADKLYKLPYVSINPEIKDINDFTIGDFKLNEYQYHPAIKYEIAK